MNLNSTHTSNISALIKLNFLKMNVYSTFTEINSIRGKFFDKDDYYEKGKGTLI